MRLDADGVAKLIPAPTREPRATISMEQAQAQADIEAARQAAPYEDAQAWLRGKSFHTALVELRAELSELRRRLGQ